MNYLYAQLNADNICVGLSQLSGEIKKEYMIRLNESEFNMNLFGKKYSNGNWEEVAE